MALAAMSREIVEPVELSRVHQSIVSTILGLVNARRALLYWVDTPSQELVCVAAAGAPHETDWLGHRMPIEHGLASRAVHEHHLVSVRRAGQADDYMLAMPLRARGKILGALTFDVVEDQAIAATDVQLLSIFAGYAALALENSQLYDDLRAALARLGESQARLLDDARLRATEDVAAGVAHHVNNRLMVILTGIQLLMERLTGDEHRRALEIVERAALNTAWLIERLRQFTLGRAPDTAIPRVVADEAMLEEALAHIMRNAIEAMSEPGTVTITTGVAGNAVLGSVADTGVGMPEDVARRAVEPFFTSKGPLRHGLGLSSALGILRQLGAQLEIESTVDVGTRVVVRLRPYVA
jgi:signal transduction histidine kinase